MRNVLRQGYRPRGQRKTCSITIWVVIIYVCACGYREYNDRKNETFELRRQIEAKRKVAESNLMMTEAETLQALIEQEDFERPK